MINPEENNHLHYDRINGETNEFEEPLDNFEIDVSDDYDGDEDYDDDRIESEWINLFKMMQMDMH